MVAAKQVVVVHGRIGHLEILAQWWASQASVHGRIGHLETAELGI